MKSIRELYKIGYGPSSSHTIGPQRACEKFMERYPKANRHKVILYGSLALTGRGHLTDAIIKKTLPNVEVEFDDQFVLWHPNTLDIKGYLDDTEIASMRVYSIGGGSIQIDGEPSDEGSDIYPHHTFEEIKEFCLDHGLRLFEYVEMYEGIEIWEFLKTILNTMFSAVDRGLRSEGVLPGELRVRRKAKQLLTKPMDNETPEVRESRIISAYAYAVSEENASGNMIVTAPTCGASGVVPAVIRYMYDQLGYKKEALLQGLATGALIGNLIKHNASISGAVAGCQAEIGSASAMAAAIHSELLGHSICQIEYAAEISLEHHLGLTCDPVLGYVQIPCIERNAVGAMRALDSSRLAYFLSESRMISLDMVIDTMYQTGKDIHTKYRETGSGGLALLYQKLKDRKGQS
ncbi:MAG: L-serine ammonia-lyase, iron-sulfur-dependent, subunit alpha [Bacilli bacterium]|nr:L-serine ammonia-lyase, iron-sulfur-dependent, subunit alpha [Bacilli bacterium]MBN2696208.1 L-serine ammonia-lyase, iron-sulfur-dependent, subunit alpha [Bacilli bacterium]